jgi:hypothetical protein
MDGVRELLDPLTQGKQRRSLARIEVYAVTGEDDEDEEVN